MSFIVEIHSISSIEAPNERQAAANMFHKMKKCSTDLQFEVHDLNTKVHSRWYISEISNPYERETTIGWNETFNVSLAIDKLEWLNKRDVIRSVGVETEVNVNYIVHSMVQVIFKNVTLQKIGIIHLLISHDAQQRATSRYIQK